MRGEPPLILDTDYAVYPIGSQKGFEIFTQAIINISISIITHITKISIKRRTITIKRRKRKEPILKN